MFIVPFKGLVLIHYKCQYLEELSSKMKDLMKLRSRQMEPSQQVYTGDCFKNEDD